MSIFNVFLRDASDFNVALGEPKVDDGRQAIFQKAFAGSDALMQPYFYTETTGPIEPELTSLRIRGQVIVRGRGIIRLNAG